MKNIIKKVLDEYVEYYNQINLDSEAARIILSEQIEERLKVWQNQKDRENIKKKEDWIKKSAIWREDILKIILPEIRLAKTTKNLITGKVDKNLIR